MDSFEIASGGAPPVVGEIRDKLLEPFITATRFVLGEMASTEVVVRAVYLKKHDNTLGDISAVLALSSETEGPLVLSFNERTAAALAERVLEGVTEDLDQSMIRDCVGEIANVIAGQAKAMLAGTPYRFTFSVPKVVLGTGPELQPKQGLDCLVVAFTSELGDFALQLFVRPFRQTGSVPLPPAE